MTTVAPPPPGELPGALLFVRYAYPPNRLGYCGPADSLAFREYGIAGVVDAGLVRLAQAFSGAWPYLELIAGATGIRDPLDRRVVEAYWVGNRLLDTVPLARIGDSAPSSAGSQRASWKAACHITASMSSASTRGSVCSATAGRRTRR